MLLFSLNAKMFRTVSPQLRRRSLSMVHWCDNVLRLWPDHGHQCHLLADRHGEEVSSSCQGSCDWFCSFFRFPPLAERIAMKCESRRAYQMDPVEPLNKYHRRPYRPPRERCWCKMKSFPFRRTVSVVLVARSCTDLIFDKEGRKGNREPGRFSLGFPSRQASLFVLLASSIPFRFFPAFSLFLLLRTHPLTHKHAHHCSNQFQSP